MVRLLRERGLAVHQVAPNLTAYDDNGQVIAEIDLLVLNAQLAVALECKSPRDAYSRPGSAFAMLSGLGPRWAGQIHHCVRICHDPSPENPGGGGGAWI